MVGQTSDPGCLCHYKSESSEHFLLDCFLYTVERQNLYYQVEHYIPNFSNLTKKSKIFNFDRRDKYNQPWILLHQCKNIPCNSIFHNEDKTFFIMFSILLTPLHPKPPFYWLSLWLYMSKLVFFVIFCILYIIFCISIFNLYNFQLTLYFSIWKRPLTRVVWKGYF